jgi:hypothetical protein
MVGLAGHKFAKRVSPSGPLVDAEALMPQNSAALDGLHFVPLADSGFSLD